MFSHFPDFWHLINTHIPDVCHLTHSTQWQTVGYQARGLRWHLVTATTTCHQWVNVGAHARRINSSHRLLAFKNESVLHASAVKMLNEYAKPRNRHVEHLRIDRNWKRNTYGPMRTGVQWLLGRGCWLLWHLIDDWLTFSPAMQFVGKSHLRKIKKTVVRDKKENLRWRCMTRHWIFSFPIGLGGIKVMAGKISSSQEWLSL